MYGSEYVKLDCSIMENALHAIINKSQHIFCKVN